MDTANEPHGQTPEGTQEFYMTVTRRGQVTLPAAVRRALKAKPFHKVKITLEGEQVRIQPVRYGLADVFGAIPPRHRPEDFKRLSREARDEHADRSRPGANEDTSAARP